jgi:hypothetical protein
MTGSDRVRMRNRFTRFFLTIVVVQNISLRMTDMTTGSDVTECYVTLKGLSWKGVRNIRPSGVFSPEMTSSNVTHRASPGTGSHVTGSALIVLSRTSASYNLIIFYELAVFHWLSAPFPSFYFNGERLQRRSDMSFHDWPHNNKTDLRLFYLERIIEAGLMQY